MAYQHEVANLIGYLDRHLAQVSAIAIETEGDDMMAADNAGQAGAFPLFDLEQGTE